MTGKLKALRDELYEHLPYTVLSVAAGLAFLATLTFVAIAASPEAPGGQEPGALNPRFGLAARAVFHVFHPLHALLSAVATVAMFWRHERRWFKAVVVGLLGSVGFCGVSDIFLPYLAGLLLGAENMEMHICIIRHPMMIAPFVIAGVLLGLLLPSSTHKSTIFSHSAHVLISSVASIMYLVAFGLTNWVEVAGMVFVYMVFAVMIPCCASDILFPLLLTGEPADPPAHPPGGKPDVN